MLRLKDKTPGYLLAKYQLIGTVTFAALFSVIFLLVSIPFSDNAWFNLSTTDVFGYTIAFLFLSLFLIIGSKRVLYLIGKKRSLYFGTYLFWNLIEIVLVCLLYTILTYQGVKRGIINIEDVAFWKVFLPAIKYGMLSLAIPYLIAGMYFAIIDKDNTIRVMNYSTVVSDEVVPKKDEKKITLFDNNGVLKLSLSSANLFYIESDDNYIKVWYTDAHDSLKQYMLRCRLKTVEESFIESSLVRCHRKYIVNMDRVKVLRKEKDSYEIELDNEQIPPIPITKTYEEHVLARFNSSRG